MPAPACKRPRSSVRTATFFSGSGTSPCGDSQGEAFDDGRLADAGLAGQDRVVLPAAGEDIDDLADLEIAAEDRIDLSAAAFAVRSSVYWSSAFVLPGTPTRPASRPDTRPLRREPPRRGPRQNRRLLSAGQPAVFRAKCDRIPSILRGRSGQIGRWRAVPVSDGRSGRGRRRNRPTRAAMRPVTIAECGRSGPASANCRFSDGREPY